MRRSQGELDDVDCRNALPGTVELAPANVAKPATDGEVGLDVDHEQVLLEAGRARDHLARVVEHDRMPVEDELVLSADEVAEREVRARVPRSCHQHLLALLRFADVVGRCGEIHHELSAGEGEIGCRRPGLP